MSPRLSRAQSLHLLCLGHSDLSRTFLSPGVEFRQTFKTSPCTRTGRCPFSAAAAACFLLETFFALLETHHSPSPACQGCSVENLHCRRISDFQVRMRCISLCLLGCILFLPAPSPSLASAGGHRSLSSCERRQVLALFSASV